MTDPAVQKYFEKKRLVYRRQVDRVMAEARVRYLEQQFRGTIRLLEIMKTLFIVLTAFNFILVLWHRGL